jgi:hypothetical protein
MTADDDHTDLVAAWRDLGDVLDSMRSRLQWSDTQYLDVSNKADRVRGLASHLSSAVLLTEQWHYSSAFALVRTSLEQLLVDWLVFLGGTFVQRVQGIDDATWERWQTERTTGAAWTDVKDWTRTKKGDVRIVREGLFSEPDADGRRQQVSIYYFLLEQYSPGLGGPAQQQDDGLIDLAELRRLATDNDALWRTYLTWSSLLLNLQENQLVDAEDAGRLASHYRFLSGYAHPVADLLRDTYGRDFAYGWPRFDHYSSELVLLYALAIGALEARNFLESLHDHPDVMVAGEYDVRAAIEQAERSSSHFWFLGSNPHAYDTWTARNEKVFRQLRDGEQNGLPPEPSAAEVPYPRDPLKRLIAMHGNAQELMSGLTYLSPWPRDEARYR